MKKKLLFLCFFQVMLSLSTHASTSLSIQVNVSKSRIEMKGGNFKGGTQRYIQKTSFDTLQVKWEVLMLAVRHLLNQ